MPEMVVEIHVPLMATPGLAGNEYPFPWIDDVQDFLANLDEQGDVQEYDDGEEDGDVYIFFITGSSESARRGRGVRDRPARSAAVTTSGRLASR